MKKSVNRFLIIITALVAMVVITSLGLSHVVTAEPNSQLQKDSKILVKNLTYVKDTRTNLCFAVYHALRNSAITTVPCSVLATRTPPYRVVE